MFSDKPIINILNEKCGEALGKFIGTSYDSFPEKIYHYTGFEGLKNILQTRRIWMTSYEYLNDPSEVNYAVSEIKNLLRKFEYDVNKIEIKPSGIPYRKP